MKTTAFIVAAAATLAGSDAQTTAATLAGSGAHTANIVNGTPAPPASYPWIVSLSQTANGRSFCGGSLIAPNAVLTAAHCIGSTNPGSMFVRVKGAGVTVPQGTEQIALKEIIPHPQYNSATQDNDVAILILATDSQITPIPYDQGLLAVDAYDGGGVTAIGWGALSEGGQQATDLMEVTVPVVSQAACNGAYPDSILPSMICAGLEAGGMDSCQGDSGGPLIRTVDGVDTLVAAVSWGIGCAQPGLFGVYARIASDSVQNFIKDKVPAAPVAPVAGAATAAPVAPVVGAATAAPVTAPAPVAAADEVCRCAGCKGKYERCGAWDLTDGSTVCLLEDPSTDPNVAPNCGAIRAGTIAYSNAFKQFYMTGCIPSGLGEQASGNTAQGLVGLSLMNNGEGPIGSGDGDDSSDFTTDVLPYLGAVAGTGFVVAGVAVVAMKRNKDTATFDPAARVNSDQMGYFDKTNTPSNARTMHL